jgi:hypothetical protein
LVLSVNYVHVGGLVFFFSIQVSMPAAEAEQEIRSLFKQERAYGVVAEYKQTPAGKHVSSKDTANNKGLTYGEVKFSGFSDVLSHMLLPLCQEGISRSFVDLGSGTGQALLVAALSGLFSRTLGMELVPGLHDIATRVIGRHNKSMVARNNTKRKTTQSMVGRNNMVGSRAKAKPKGKCAASWPNRRSRKGGGGGMLNVPFSIRPDTSQKPTLCQVELMCCSILDKSSVEIWTRQVALYEFSTLRRPFNYTPVTKHKRHEFGLTNWLLCFALYCRAVSTLYSLVL